MLDDHPNQSAPPGPELSARAVCLGVLITLVFTAANVYFGLKAGLTFATSIPAAVISMAVLRGFKNTTIRENNIVQTVASAAGTLSAIIFVLPGLVMIGWWTGFPYVYSCSICALGGILGVMYSIPLRRALVTQSNLPFPEGVACAEVLKVGAQTDGGSAHWGAAHERRARHANANEGYVEEGTVPAGVVNEGTATAGSRANRYGLMGIVVGSVVSALFAVIIGTQVFASDVAQYFRLGQRGAVTGYDFNLSFALLAVGHLVGLWVGIAMLVGTVIAWAFAVPILSSLHPTAGPAAQVGLSIWSHQVRFFGAGAIGVASIWTLFTLVKPLAAGLRAALAASRLRSTDASEALPRSEQDIPIGVVAAVTLLCMLPIGWLLANFGAAAGLGSQALTLVVGGIVYIVVMSFFVAAVCGYMAGLIGASNSPLSGVGILVVLGAALGLVFGVKPFLGASAGPALVAFALFVTAVVFCAATIANDNLQDLKTGELVGATPWRQQVALIVGVVAGAVVIPPILDLLNHAYGFAGAPGADPARALAAPQATLISALARGVIQGNLDWNLIGAGALLGVGVIVADRVLRRFTTVQLPPLAVGLGIYLPSATSLMIVVGAIAGWLYDRRAARTADPDGVRQLGVLMASGLIVGESLVGVALAAIVVFSGRATPLALVGEDFAGASVWVGGIAFVLAAGALYAWLNRLSGPARVGVRRSKPRLA